MTRNQLLELFPVGPERPSSRRYDPISAGIGAVGSIVSGIMGSNAANNAAKIQQQNAQNVANMANNATQQGQQTLSNVYGSEQAALNPYLTAGTNGLTMLNNAVAPGGSLSSTFSFDPSQITQDQGYQFQLQQGQKALEQAAAAKGQALGGGTLKALDAYTQGLASTEYQNAYNRSLTTFQTNRSNALGNIQALLQPGEFGTQSFQSAAQNYGNTSANLGLQGTQIAASALTGGAQAAAAGQIGSANAWSNALGGLTNAGQMLSLGNTFNKMYNAGVLANAPDITGSGGPQMSGGDMVAAMGGAGADGL